MLLIWLFCLLTNPLQADPWGKDADLCCLKSETVIVENIRPSPLSKIGDCLILFHQKVISPADGPRSHFIPSSSQYTRDAMRKYGFFKGFIMGCDRLMRENSDPWIYRTTTNSAGEIMKWDPVP